MGHGGSRIRRQLLLAPLFANGYIYTRAIYGAYGYKCSSHVEPLNKIRYLRAVEEASGMARQRILRGSEKTERLPAVKAT